MDTVWSGDWFQARERFEARIARHLVAGNCPCPVGSVTFGFRRRNLDRHELRFETVPCNRARRSELRFKTEMIGILARDPVFGGDPLSALELAHELEMFAVFTADRLAEPGLGARDRIGANREETHVLDAASKHHVFGP